MPTDLEMHQFMILYNLEDPENSTFSSASAAVLSVARRMHVWVETNPNCRSRTLILVMDIVTSSVLRYPPSAYLCRLGKLGRFVPAELTDDRVLLVAEVQELRQLRPLAVEDAVRVDHLRPELRPAREDAHASPEVAVGYLRSPVPPQDLKRALQPRVQFNFKTCSKTQTQISTTMRFDKLTVHRCT